MDNATNTTVKTFEIAPTDDLAQGRVVKGVLQAKSVNMAARTVDGIASTINIDRDGDVILPSALAKDLSRFLATSAPFLAAHRHRSEDGSPTQIGWVTRAVPSPSDVRCSFQYALTDVAEQWWKLASDPAGKGHAFSIGFIPLKALRGSAADAVRAMPELAGVVEAAHLRDGDPLTVYTELELLEMSACPVPSNRESLQLLSAKLFGMEDGAKAAEELKKLIAEAVESAISNPQSEIRKIAQAAIDHLFREMSIELDRQIGEIKCLLPDSVNPNEDPSARQGSSGADDAAAGKARARDMKRAADALQGKQTNSSQ